MRNVIGSLFLGVLLLSQQSSRAQSVNPPAAATGTGAGSGSSTFDQHESFAPFFYPSFGDDLRAASGAPGPKYWQNHVDYKIDARLDEVNHSLSGTVNITYKNNSPQD